jgi:hypothetical protein
MIVKLNVIVCENSSLLTTIVNRTFKDITDNVLVMPERNLSMREFYEKCPLIEREENWVFTTSIIVVDAARVWQRFKLLDKLHVTWIDKEKVSSSSFTNGNNSSGGSFWDFIDIQSELIDKLLQTNVRQSV